MAFVRAIALPRVEGRIDHLAFDAATGRLYVAALGEAKRDTLELDGEECFLAGIQEIAKRISK